MRSRAMRSRAMRSRAMPRRRTGIASRAARGKASPRRGLAARPVGSLAPHLARHLDDEAELGFLFLDRQRVAVDGRGEAALRAEAELLERHVAGRLLDAALQFVLGFERRPLGRDETEHHLLRPLRHKAQRRKAARAGIVIFEKEAVDLEIAEQY